MMHAKAGAGVSELSNRSAGAAVTADGGASAELTDVGHRPSSQPARTGRYDDVRRHVLRWAIAACTD